MTTLPHEPDPTAVAKKRWFRQPSSKRYLCLPMAAVTDRRLKHESLKVLLALALHADPNGKCHPSRGLLSKLTGIHPVNVSKATRTLEGLGWLRKEPRKGRSSEYFLRMPSSLVADQSPTDDLDAFLTANGHDPDA